MFPTRARPFKWQNLLRSFKSSPEESNQEEDCKTQEIIPTFDKRYRTILRCKLTPDIQKIIDWVNLNSIGAVVVNFGFTNEFQHDAFDSVNTVFFAFEKEDDAMFFKITHLI